MGGFSILITHTICKTPDIMLEVEYKITVLSCGVPPGSFGEAVKYVNSTAGTSKEPGQIEHRSQCDLVIIPYVTVRGACGQILIIGQLCFCEV
jgi:hypothetical protein